MRTAYYVLSGTCWVRTLERRRRIAEFFKVWGEFLVGIIYWGYNLPFDLMMMQSEGIDTKGWRCFDVMVLVFNADTNIKHNSLNGLPSII